MTLCAFRPEEFWGLFRSHPGRSYDLTRIAAVEEHFLGETIASRGQRDVIQRVSTLFVRMHEKLLAVGFLVSGKAPLPCHQQDMADALGPSLVHTNKTLQGLQARGLAQWADGKLVITDMGALAALAMIDRQKPKRRSLM